MGWSGNVCRNLTCVGILPWAALQLYPPVGGQQPMFWGTAYDGEHDCRGVKNDGELSAADRPVACQHALAASGEGKADRGQSNARRVILIPTACTGGCPASCCHGLLGGEQMPALSPGRGMEPIQVGEFAFIDGCRPNPAFAPEIRPARAARRSA
jgi:hypothetical protein